MSRKRDYRKEYERRIANAAKRGLSRSQARGHARAGEAPVKAKPVQSDEHLEAALRLLRQTGNQSRAAKEAGVSAERFRRFLRANSLAERQGKRWHVTDNRTRTMRVRTGGEERLIELCDFEQASLNGRHLAATETFSRTNDIDLLRPFEGQSVIGADGQSYPLETNPSALHRLFNAGGEEFHVIYQLNL